MELGEAIKARRLERGLTLDGLAERAGVSRGMLSEIERGVKNPTIRIVAQIAAALGTTVARLIGEDAAEDEGGPTIVRAAARRTLLDPQTGVAQQDLAPDYRRLGVAVGWWTIPPGGATGPLPPERPGTVAQLVVVRGPLRCRLGTRDHALDSGDALFFAADLPHSFANPGDAPCDYLLIVDARGPGA